MKFASGQVILDLHLDGHWLPIVSLHSRSSLHKKDDIRLDFRSDSASATPTEIKHKLPEY
jgi:hypothetical protein